MEKVQYGDVNRFLVSMGLVLILLSLALPYFYLTNDFGLYIEESKIKQFTLPVQNLICDKQRLLIKIQGFIPGTSISLFIIGVITLIAGLWRWFRRQAQIDKKENLDIQKLELEINKLTPEEKIEKAQNEVQAIEVAEIIEEKRKNPNSKIETDQKVSNYLDIEKRVIDHFKNYKSTNFEIMDNVKVAGRFWIDILLEAKTAEFSDRIIKIRFSRGKLNYSFIKDTLSQIDKYNSFYLRFYNRKVVPILIIIFTDESNATVQQLRELAQKVRSDSDNYDSLKRLQTHFVNEKDIETFDVQNLLRR